MGKHADQAHGVGSVVRYMVWACAQTQSIASLRRRFYTMPLPPLILVGLPAVRIAQWDGTDFDKDYNSHCPK